MEGLNQGTSDQSLDMGEVIYRMKMLGFNAIRLPMSFDNHWGLGQVLPTLTTHVIGQLSSAQQGI